MTSMTVRATEGIDEITARDAARSKNLFALGLVSWMYGRPTEPTVAWIEKKFADTPGVGAANLAAFRAGYNFGETAELLAVHYEVDAAPAPPGTYRNVNGTQALAWRLVAAAVQSGLGLFYASYPITPASELLHSLSRHHKLGVRTVQAEDEIAAVNMALGAAFAGQLGVTATSGPGMDLKAETIGSPWHTSCRSWSDVQRAGPSTGMPTKTEAADLLMALYGRHGESPLPVIAASTPSTASTAPSRRRASRSRTDARDPAHRHVPGEPRALAAARRGLAAEDRPGLRHRSHRLHALRAQTPGLARPPAVPGTPGCATASAGSRRRTARATSPTSPPTTST